MNVRRHVLKTFPLISSAAFCLFAMVFSGSVCVAQLPSAPAGGSGLSPFNQPAESRASFESAGSGVAVPMPYAPPSGEVAGTETESNSTLPSAPEPALDAVGGNPQREGVPWAAEWHQEPFSRIGIGADVSLLGIGIKVATPLDQYFDVRGLFNFFSYNQGRIEVDGFNIYGGLHLASVAAAADFYPKNSIWRLSGGMFLYNGNKVTVATNAVGGTSFTVDGKTYYSSTTDPASGNVELDMNTAKAAPMFSFGFGRFVPHSNRHWSFPTEFGAVYMGVPALTVTTAGSVCTDAKQTMCSSISDTGTPVGQEFNTSLNAQLARWRKTLQNFKFYPIFSYSVVYSFNIK